MAMLIGAIVGATFYGLSVLVGYLLERTYSEEKEIEDLQNGIVRFRFWKRDLVAFIMFLILIGLWFL